MSVRCFKNSTMNCRACASQGAHSRDRGALLVDRVRSKFGPRLTGADPAHELHRQSRHRQDDGRGAHGRDPPPAGLCAPRTSGRVTRDDLVGQYIGHTAPETKEVLKKAMGGVLFIDEAYYLYRQENERDYGQESIEILLQIMENNRDDLVVILAGYADKMDRFFHSNPASARASPITSTFPTIRTPTSSKSAKGCWPRSTTGCLTAQRGARRIHCSQARSATLRQRSFAPQRPRPGALAPSQSSVRRAR